MTLRGTLYRCHFFTFGGPQTEGALSQWTRDFQPITDVTGVLPGQLVELHSQIERTLLPDPLAAVYRFDILEEDSFLAGSDDVVVAITGPGAHAIDADWPVSARVLTTVVPGAGMTPVDAARAFRREHDADFYDYLVVIVSDDKAEPYHLVTWWTSQVADDPGSECELYFILNVKTGDAEFDDQTEDTLDLPIQDPVRPEVGPLHMRIASPDEEDDLANVTVAFSVSAAVMPGPPEAVAWALGNDEPEPEALAIADEPLATKVRPTPPAPPPAPPSQEVVATTTEVEIVAGEEDPEPEGCMPKDIMARFLRRPPTADRSDDATVFGDAQSHGEITVAIINNFTPLKFRSQPHPVVYNMRRAVREGNALFRTVGYAIVEGPFTSDDSRRGYHVLPLEEPLTRDELAIERRYAERQVFPVRGYYYAPEIKSIDHGWYTLRTIATADDIVLFAGARHRDLFFCEQSQTDENSEEAALSPAAKAHIAGVLAGADKKLASDREAALEDISRLGSDAFALATSAQRGAYLKAYFGDWWLSERDQRSLRQIVLASASPEEIREHVDAMRADGGLNRMIGNLNGGVFGFLGDIGQRFEKELSARYPFTFEEVASWIVDKSAKPITIAIGPPGVPGIAINVQTGEVVFDTHAIEQLRTALTSFLQFAVGTVQDMYHLFSEPGKLFDAIGQLMELIVAVELARWGHAPSVAKIKKLADSLAKHAKHLYYALRLLNLEQQLADQIRFRITWEVASMFVGIGEIKAAVSATRGAIASTRLTQRVASVSRIVEVLGEGERGLVAMEDAARAISRTLKAEPDLALRAVSDLPDGQLSKLGAAVAEAKPEAARTLTQLADAAPTAAARQVIEDSADMMKTALQTEKKVGRRLQDEARSGLRRLFEVQGLAPTEVRRVLAKLHPDDTEGFLRAASRVLTPPADGAAVASRLTPAQLGQLAQHPRAIQLAMLRHEQSPAVLLRLVEDSGGNMYTVERAADAVQSVMWSRANRSRQEAQRLIERVAANEPGALQEAVGVVDGYLRATDRAVDADRLAAAAASGTSRELRTKVGQALRERGHRMARASIDDFMGGMARGEAAALEEARTARMASSVLNGDARVGAVVDPRYRSLVEDALAATSRADADRALAELRQLADQEMAGKVRAAVSTPINELTPELAALRRQLKESHPGVFPAVTNPETEPFVAGLTDIAVDNAAAAMANRFADRAARRVDAARIGRSLDPAVLLPNNPAGQRLLRAFDAEAWESVISKGDGFLDFFRRDPGVATPIVAGQLREELMYVAPSFGEVMNRARQRAARLAEEGVILNDVRLMRSQGGQNFGKMVGDSASSIAGESALTDNFIGAFDQNGNLHVLSVYESKSMTNVDALFPSIDLTAPGQVLRDIERLDATALKVNDVWVDAEKIVVGRSRTEWVLAIPPDVPFPEAGLRRLLGESPALNLNGRVYRGTNLPAQLPAGMVARHPLNNGEVQGTMRRIMQALDGVRP